MTLSVVTRRARRPMSALWRVATLALAFTAAGAPVASAQQGATGSIADWGPPAWMKGWSPLRPAGDVVLELPAAAPRPDLLLTPAPRVGLLWTAGLAAALPLEVEDHRTEFRATRHGASGAYRRPLDPADPVDNALAGAGWSPLGERGAVIGEAAFELDSFDPSSFSHLDRPYTTSPLVPTDTSRPEVRRARARLEGAGGRRIGGWGVGLAAGYEAADNRSRHSGLPRLGRAATFGAAAGAARPIFGNALRVGGQGRFLTRSETVTIVSTTRSGEVYQFAGYSDPPPIAVTPTTGPYRRRIDSHAWEVGLAAAGRWPAARLEWTAFARRSWLDEAQSSQRSNDPPKDRWDTDGFTFGGALRRSFGRGRASFAGGAHRTDLTGGAERADVSGVIMRKDAVSQAAWLELRWPPASRGWGGAVAISAGMEQRVAWDFIEEFSTGVRNRWGGGAVEIARSFRNDLTLSGGFGLSVHWARSVLPDTSVTGLAYDRIIAPELALLSQDATAWTGTLAARWRPGGSTAVVARAALGALEPRGYASALLPGGDRRAWAVTLGVVLGAGAPGPGGP